MHKTLGISILLCISIAAFGQGVCPTTTQSSKLICVIPQVYGPAGLTLPNTFHAAHFENDFVASFTPLNSAIGTELSLLPLASPASGFTFTFDPSAGVMTRSAESFGPVLTERAETIGRHRIYIAFTYQHFGCSSLDDVSLKRLPAVYTHIDVNPPSPGTPNFEREFITTSNRLDLKTNQFTGYATFGLTNRIDLSLAIPILDVHFAVSSSAHIVRSPLNPPVLKFGGYSHFFDPACAATPNQPPTPAQLACQAASTDKTFTNSGQAAGIGDLVLRLKGTVFNGERARAALGIDGRLPTGDANNFLGSGTFGVKPFIAMSYRARVSPHVNIGYQWNGKSILGGNVQKGTEARLPDQLFYSGGVDLGVNKRLTFALDLVGQRLMGATTLRTGPYTDIVGVPHPDIAQSTFGHSSINLDDLSVGAKVAPIGKLLVTANVLIKLNEGGLRSRAVPLVGLSYTF